LRHGRKRIANSTQALQVSDTQILDENPEGPTVGDRMMNREDQDVVIRAAAHQLHPVKRSLHEIERLPEHLTRKILDVARGAFVS
jgi:hypothetical protein